MKGKQSDYYSAQCPAARSVETERTRLAQASRSWRQRFQLIPMQYVQNIYVNILQNVLDRHNILTKIVRYARPA